MAIIRKYAEWNSALWQYFFPNRDENPILWVDETVLQQAANGKVKLTENDVKEDFLSCTLLSREKLAEFLAESCRWGINLGKVSKWSDLASSLLTQKIKTIDTSRKTSTPAYFAMLCAIMYLACKKKDNITHDYLKRTALPYLGGRPDKFGELIDPFFSQLHKDVYSFEEDGMTCGNQINISRLKFHSIMRSSQREDLKDIIEISGLKWEDEPYYEYVNNKLIPALACAGKKDLLDIVQNSEYAPCIKSILLEDLDFDRTESVLGNIRQAIQIKCKHELYVDVLGTPTFYLSQNSWTPFSISLCDGGFCINTSGINSEFIALGVDLGFYESSKNRLEHEGNQDIYEIGSISQSDEALFFCQVGHDYYVECAEPLNGQSYLMFLKRGASKSPYRNLAKGLQVLDNLSSGQYDAYMIDSYEASQTKKGKKDKNERVFSDEYKFNRVGAWCSITISDNEDIYWKPNIIGGNEPQRLDKFTSANGKTFFQIPSQGRETISGKIFVSTDKGNTLKLIDGKILHTFAWNGENSLYHINGWGLTTTEKSPDKNHQEPSSKITIQRESDKPLNGLGILIYVLRDIADPNGCVGQRKMVNALNFVMDYYGIIPTTKNRKSILYALRTLGYLIAYYNPQTREYENQLCSPYLEKVNYSINSIGNAYLIKGFYSYEMFNCLNNEIQRRERTINKSIQTSENSETKNRFIRYKRPYSSESKYSDEHGYTCLPDHILVELDDTAIEKLQQTGWAIQNFTAADKLTSLMEDMSGFTKAFGIDSGGDICHNPSYDNMKAPFMVHENDSEYLCTRKGGATRIHKRFNDNGSLSPIPKHISRTYCQNSNGHPLLIMTEYNSDKKTVLNYGEVLFTSGMGCPSMLKMALCDLNLGLQKNILTFNANRDVTFGCQHYDHQKLEIKRGYTLRTCATTDNHKMLKRLISKLAGKNINDLASSGNVVHIRKEFPLIELWSYQNSLDNCYVVATKNNEVTDHKDVIAVCKQVKGSSCVYYLNDKDSDNKTYYKVNGEDPNKILSDIINDIKPETDKKHPLTLGSELEQDIANKVNCREITIIN